MPRCITLAGVGEVADDPAVARDQFAKFVTKNPAATYASLDARQRVKANFAMAFATQELERISNLPFATYDDHPLYQIVDRGDQPDKYRQAIFALAAHFNLGIEWGPSFVADLR